MNLFKPEEKNLDELFISKTTYTIPSYQRLYTWEAKGKSDRDSQVNVMWEDLIEHFEHSSDKHYFMGSMVVIGSDNAFEVVDGQQRLTTLTLLFVAIKCMLQELGDSEIENKNKKEIKDFIEKRAIGTLDSFLFNEMWKGLIVKEKKVKIERSGGFDYDNALKIAMECGNINSITDLKDISEEQRKTVYRYFDNRNFFKENLREYFLKKGVFTEEKVKLLNDFIDFLQKKVTVIRISCPSLDIAYQIFEILNNRGLPLSNKDLFRNFIIKELDKEGIDNPEQKWLNLDKYEFSVEFLSRYVESTNARKQRYSAFNDVKEIYDKVFRDGIAKKKVELFYEDIEKNLTHYSNLELLSFDNVAIAHRINFLKNSGNARYINNILLALMRSTKEEEDKLIMFLREFELLILYQLIGPSKRFQTKTIFEAIDLLNKNKFKEAVKKVTLTKSEKDDLKNILKNNDIAYNDLGRLMLARYFWAKEIDHPNDVINVELNYKSATLEHIIPQSPKDNTNWQIDFTDTFKKEYTYKLGNMTLLTKPMNSQAKNYDFSRKKETYKKTKLAMTVELAQLIDIDENYIKNRHHQITNYLIKHLEL